MRLFWILVFFNDFTIQNILSKNLYLIQLYIFFLSEQNWIKITWNKFNYVIHWLFYFETVTSYAFKILEIKTTCLFIYVFFIFEKKNKIQ